MRNDVGTCSCLRQETPFPEGNCFLSVDSWDEKKKKSAAALGILESLEEKSLGNQSFGVHFKIIC